MLNGLKALVGEKILRADLSENFDLVIRCSSDVKLKIFHRRESAGENYSIFSPGREAVNA